MEKSEAIDQMLDYVRSMQEMKMDYRCFTDKQRDTVRDDMMLRLSVCAEGILGIYNRATNPSRPQIITPNNKKTLNNYAEAQEEFNDGETVMVELHDEDGIYAAEVFSKANGNTIMDLVYDPDYATKGLWFRLSKEMNLAKEEGI